MSNGCERDDVALQRYYSRDVPTSPHLDTLKKERNGCRLVDLISPLQRASLGVCSLLWKNERKKTCALFTTCLSTTTPCADKEIYCRKMDFSSEEVR